MSILAVVAVSPILAWLAMGFAESYFDLKTQRELRWQLERDLGFTIDTPYVNGKEVITIGTVREGGILARAGVRPGEVVVDYRSIGLLCLDLEEMRGKEFTLTVVEGGDGIALEKRTRIQKTFLIPLRENRTFSRWTLFSFEMTKQLVFSGK